MPKGILMTASKERQHIFIYAAALAALVLFLKWMEWKFLLANNSIEIYIGLIALFFTILGIWIAKQLIKPKVEIKVVEKEVLVYPSPEIDEAMIEKLELSAREYEILQLIAKGLSNDGIAKTVFLSVSTVKTHVSNLYFKLDVKSRTQAIEKAKQLKIIA